LETRTGSGTSKGQGDILNDGNYLIVYLLRSLVFDCVQNRLKNASDRAEKF
jgi:hypothetical protein